MNTRTYILSSTTVAAGTDGYDIYESGPTNLVISFSGVVAHAAGVYNYLKFLVEYPDDTTIYTVQSLDALHEINIKTIDRVFYPTDSTKTTYQIDVSGIRTDFVVDLYRINLIIGKQTATAYKSFDIVNSHLFSNQHATNQLLLTLEAQSPQYITNILVPYTKDTQVYIPPTPSVFVPTDDNILRTESNTFISKFQPLASLMPVLTEKTTARNIVEEKQLVYLVMGTEFNADEGVQHNGRGRMTLLDNLNQRGYPLTHMGAPTDINGISPYSGDTSEDTIIFIPEDGIDYLEDVTPDSLAESSNKTYTGIYPDGILQ